MPKTFNYAAALMRQGFRLASQTIDVMDDMRRTTKFHISAGLMPRDISFLDTYKKNTHVIAKSSKESDLFHATISEDQIKLVLKHGELFDTKKEGRVQCYRMFTTKEAKKKTYSGYTEVSIDTQRKEIVHAFFNKNKNKAIALS